MIVTRTPLRISLVGGGTDVASFYHQSFGAVVSFAINKYIYVSLNEKFDGKTRASYSEMEIVEDPLYIKHDIIRGALSYFQVRGIEITSVSDIPGEGCGLGSSSAFTVGLLLGLLKYTNKSVNSHPSYYAELAYHLEREKSHHAVGKQDHYAAAYGGLYYYRFNADETVATEPIPLTESNQHRLENELMLFWTGKTRAAGDILTSQEIRLRDDPRIRTAGTQLRDLAVQFAQEMRNGNVDCVGAYLNENWHLKKKLSHGVSDRWIDDLYDKALAAGATGGKLCGAGGGGFLLMAVKQHKQYEVEKALGLRRVPWKMCSKGSMIVYKDEL